MPHVSNMTVSVGRKRSDGNYGSYETFLSATVIPLGNENIEEEMLLLHRHLTKKVDAMLKEMQGIEED